MGLVGAGGGGVVASMIIATAYEVTAAGTAVGAASIAGATFTGAACVGLALSGIGVAAGVVAIAVATNWSYEQKLQFLKENMTEDIENKAKFMLIEKYMAAFEKVVDDCEKHNFYI